ncbi:hypothetical protein Bbelb_168160 [Branchiostoma belcheri]|nr:hypothetical protein Bbelb_168160 [Branchiostoma belcheri]
MTQPPVHSRMLSTFETFGCRRRTVPDLAEHQPTTADLAPDLLPTMTVEATALLYAEQCFIQNLAQARFGIVHTHPEPCLTQAFLDTWRLSRTVPNPNPNSFRAARGDKARISRDRAARSPPEGYGDFHTYCSTYPEQSPRQRVRTFTWPPTIEAELDSCNLLAPTNQGSLEFGSSLASRTVADLAEQQPTTADLTPNLSLLGSCGTLGSCGAAAAFSTRNQRPRVRVLTCHRSCALGKGT